MSDIPQRKTTTFVISTSTYHDSQRVVDWWSEGYPESGTHTRVARGDGTFVTDCKTGHRYAAIPLSVESLEWMMRELRAELARRDTPEERARVEMMLRTSAIDHPTTT